ncbi:MAG TPA: histidine phosphatase family protein [Roseiflexaceae bacterium]|nr:histidine phosphatase family protein [Roseiflexaceae bacterium]
MLEELFLVRHAEPDRSLAMPYNIMPGPPLTPRGREEAAQAAAWLEGKGVEYMFASPFERASATADIIVDRLGLPITYTQILREGGPGESLDQIQARVGELLGQLDDGPLLRVALVSHGACLRGLLRYTTANRIDLSRHIYDYGNNTPTAGIWHGIRREGAWVWNLTFRPVFEQTERSNTKSG